MVVNEKMTEREKHLLFQILQLVRRKLQDEFYDWKDVDDWLFSEIDITSKELEQIYKDKKEMIYTASCIDCFEDVSE